MPPVADRARGEIFEQPRAVGVVADDADRSTRPPSATMLLRDVGGAAEPPGLVVEADDRDRRFGRDAIDGADDELIDHQVADDEDRTPGKAIEDSSRRRHGAARTRPSRSTAGAGGALGGVGQRDEDEEQHQEFGVAEIVFEHARRPASRRRRRCRPSASDGSGDVLRFAGSRAAACTTNHSQMASAGRPRSAAICSGTLCRCGLQLADGAVALAIAGIDLDHHVGPDAGERVVLDDAEPALDHRQPVAVRLHASTCSSSLSPTRDLQRQHRREAIGDRASARRR